MLTIERSLNVYAAGLPQIINLSQYDDDFQLVFTLYTSEGALTVPSGTTAEVMGTKTDGNGYSADAVISGNTVTVTGNVQMTACAGRNVFEVVLTNSGKRLATLNFILQVERAAMDADTIQSETVLKELNAIIDGADRAEAAAGRAEEAADTIDETVADLKEDLSQKAPAIYNTSDEAEVVTFADGAEDMPMKSVVLKLVPHQEGSGDPSPSNVRPISGYTSVNVKRSGKNLIPFPYQSGDSLTSNGISWTVNADGSVTANGTATGTSLFWLYGTSTSPLMPTLEEGEEVFYTINGESRHMDINGQIVFYGGTAVTLSSSRNALTIPSMATHTGMVVILRIGSGTAVNNASSMSISMIFSSFKVRF